MTAKVFPLHPASPQRICWGCDRYCAADSLACSAERTPHLAELFGDDWATWSPATLPGDRAAGDPTTPGRDQAPIADPAA